MHHLTFWIKKQSISTVFSVGISLSLAIGVYITPNHSAKALDTSSRLIYERSVETTANDGGSVAGLGLDAQGQVFSGSAAYFAYAGVDQYGAQGGLLRTIGESTRDELRSGLVVDGKINTFYGMQLITDGDKLYVGGEEQACRMQVFSTQTGQYIDSLAGPCSVKNPDRNSETITSAALTTNGTFVLLYRVYDADSNASYEVVEMSKSGTIMQRHPVDERYTRGSIFGVHGTDLYVANASSSEIQVISYATGELIRSIAKPDIGGGEWGRYYYVMDGSGRILALNEETHNAVWLTSAGAVIGNAWNMADLLPSGTSLSYIGPMTLSQDSTKLAVYRNHYDDAGESTSYIDIFSISQDAITPESNTVAVNGNKPLDQTPTIPSRPTFSGATLPGATVKVVVHSDPVSCSTVADSNGNWSCTLPSDLPAGSHTAYITVTDPDGEVTELGPYPVIVAGQTVTGNLLAPDSGVGGQKINTAIVATIGIISAILLLFGYLTSKRQSKR